MEEGGKEERRPRREGRKRGYIRDERDEGREFDGRRRGGGGRKEDGREEWRWNKGGGRRKGDRRKERNMTEKMKKGRWRE